MSQVCETTILASRRSPAPAATVAAPTHDTVFHGAVLSVCTAALILSFVLKPDADGMSLFGFRWPWSCWLYDRLGVRCALCGLSRSFCCLARGDIVTAVGFHRLGPLVFALFCLEIPYRLYAIIIRPRRIAAGLARIHVVIATLVAVALFANWLLYLGELVA